jgi:hypothetical protein
MIEKDIRRLINLVEEKSEDQTPKQLNESTGATDYNPKSQGGTRKELLAKYRKTKDPKDAEAARKAGATQQELKQYVEEGENIGGKRYDKIADLKGRTVDQLNKLIQKFEGIVAKYPDHTQASEYLGLAKMIRAEKIGKKPVSEQGVAEGMDPNKRSRLDDLIDKYKDSVDPEYDSYGSEDHYDSEDIIAQIRSEFGDNIADQVEAGAEKMHFGRPGHKHGYDPLGWRKPIDRQTKAGKMFKQDSDYRKNMVKSRYKLSGKSATESVAEGGMPASVIKQKQQLADMSDKEFAEKYGNKSDEELMSMAWRHGYGKGSKIYVNKCSKGKQGATEKSDTMESKSLIAQGINKILKR